MQDIFFIAAFASTDIFFNNLHEGTQGRPQHGHMVLTAEPGDGLIAFDTSGPAHTTDTSYSFQLKHPYARADDARFLLPQFVAAFPAYRLEFWSQLRAPETGVQARLRVLFFEQVQDASAWAQAKPFDAWNLRLYPSVVASQAIAATRGGTVSPMAWKKHVLRIETPRHLRDRIHAGA